MALADIVYDAIIRELEEQICIAEEKRLYSNKSYTAGYIAGVRRAEKRIERLLIPKESDDE